jgi:hypothetical protein
MPGKRESGRGGRPSSHPPSVFGRKRGNSGRRCFMSMDHRAAACCWFRLVVCCFFTLQRYQGGQTKYRKMVSFFSQEEEANHCRCRRRRQCFVVLFPPSSLLLLLPPLSSGWMDGLTRADKAFSPSPSPMAGWHRIHPSRFQTCFFVSCRKKQGNP